MGPFTASRRCVLVPRILQTGEECVRSVEREAVWPIEDDTTLVRIVAGPEVDRSAQWDAWAASVDLDHLSPAAYGLLPALYAAMEPLGVEHPWMARLRGVYRREWTESRRHLASAEAVGAALAAAGIAHLDPADQQIARVVGGASVQRLDRPRVVVDWWSAPKAIEVLAAAGWVSAQPAERQSAKARLTATRWSLTSGGGAAAELTTSFLPFLVDERREADLWERAASGAADGAGVHPADLAVAALCDQLDLAGAVRWVPGALAVIDASASLDLRPTLDRRVARVALPLIGARLDFLAAEGLGRNTGDLRAQVADLLRRHPLPTSSAERAVERVRGAARMVRRQPRAVREVTRRHGGVTEVVAAMRRS